MHKVMTHVVAGYPDVEKCIELMRGMEKAGVGMIEVQIPFSDPVADGETIMQANDTALSNGMTIAASFGLISSAALGIDVYVMSYFQKIHHIGTEKFCEAAASAGAKGLIIPDLPHDAPEYNTLLKVSLENNLALAPVISPDMSIDRLRNSTENAQELIYLTSTKGITGKSLKVGPELAETTKKVKNLKPQADLAIGFGIASRHDLEEVLKIADIGIIGSEVIRKIDSSGIDSAINFIAELTAS